MLTPLVALAASSFLWLHVITSRCQCQSRPLRVAMSPFEWRVLLFIILREIVSSVPRPLHSSSLPAENLTIKEGGTIYERVIRTRSLNSQVKLPGNHWLEFRFSNNKWSAGYPDDRYPRITGAGLVTEVTPDERLRPIFTISRSKFSQRPGEDAAQLIFLLLGQVTPSGIR